MSKNTERISHQIGNKQNAYRNASLDQILNDINEGMEAIGFTEYTYTQTVFISKITVWESMAKTKKRSEITFNYGDSFPFIETITEDVYNEDGTAVVAQTVMTLNYFANKLIQNVLVETTRL